MLRSSGRASIENNKYPTTLSYVKRICTRPRVGRGRAEIGAAVINLLPPTPTHYMLSPPAYISNAACTAYRGSGVAQRVQMQLKGAEQTQKDDSSPVTIADYGAK